MIDFECIHFPQRVMGWQYHFGMKPIEHQAVGKIRQIYPYFIDVSLYIYLMCYIDHYTIINEIIEFLKYNLL